MNSKRHLMKQAARMAGQGKPYGQITHQLGISRTTFYLWRRDPVFQALRYRHSLEQEQSSECATHELKDRAQERLAELLDHGDERIMLQAAKEILRMG